LVFEADGHVRRHAGGYSDWVLRNEALAVVDEPEAGARRTPAATRAKTQPARKLSYKLQRELDSLPAEIASLERRVAELRAVVVEPDFYRREQTTVQQHLAELQAAEHQLEVSVERWAELEQQGAAQASSPPPAND